MKKAVLGLHDLIRWDNLNFYDVHMRGVELCAGAHCENTVQGLADLIRRDNAGQLLEGALAYVEFDLHVSPLLTGTAAFPPFHTSPLVTPRWRMSTLTCTFVPADLLL